MSIGIVGAGNMGRSIAVQLAQTEDVALTDRNPGKAEAVVAVIGGDGVEVSELVEAAGLRPIHAGRLDNARPLERLSAFQIELSQRYGLDFRLAFNLLPAALPG